MRRGFFVVVVDRASTLAPDFPLPTLSLPRLPSSSSINQQTAKTLNHFLLPPPPLCNMVDGTSLCEPALAQPPPRKPKQARTHRTGDRDARRPPPLRPTACQNICTLPPALLSPRMSVLVPPASHRATCLAPGTKWGSRKRVLHRARVDPL